MRLSHESLIPRDSHRKLATHYRALWRKETYMKQSRGTPDTNYRARRHMKYLVSLVTHSRESFIEKEPLIIGLFCGKWRIKIYRYICIQNSCIYTYRYVYMIYIYTYTHSCVIYEIYIYMYIYTYIFTYTYVYIHIYLHIHTFIYISDACYIPIYAYIRMHI